MRLPGPAFSPNHRRRPSPSKLQSCKENRGTLHQRQKRRRGGRQLPHYSFWQTAAGRGEEGPLEAREGRKEGRERVASSFLPSPHTFPQSPTEDRHHSLPPSTSNLPPPLPQGSRREEEEEVERPMLRPSSLSLSLFLFCRRRRLFRPLAFLPPALSPSVGPSSGLPLPVSKEGGRWQQQTLSPPSVPSTSRYRIRTTTTCNSSRRRTEKKIKTTTRVQEKGGVPLPDDPHPRLSLSHRGCMGDAGSVRSRRRRG